LDLSGSRLGQVVGTGEYCTEPADVVKMHGISWPAEELLFKEYCCIKLVLSEEYRS
jgi:hypothetical protein